MSTDNPIHLSEEDTWNMWVDAADAWRFWATVRTEHHEHAHKPVNGWGGIASWYVDFVVEDTDGPVHRLNHERVLRALRTIGKNEGDAYPDDMVEAVRGILSAPDNGKATDWVCQLDVYGFNAIVQVAAFGTVSY